MFEFRQVVMHNQLNVQNDIPNFVTFQNARASVSPYHYRSPMDEEASRYGTTSNNGTTSISHNSNLTRQLFCELV